MDSLLQDLRVSWRALLRYPTFTLAVVLTLGLAIGANTAVFSILDGVLLRPAPVADLDRLVMLWQTDRNSGTTREPSSVPDYLDFAREAKQVEQVAAFAPSDLNLAGDGTEPRRVAALNVTPNFLTLLDAQPKLGRVFTAEDATAGQERVVLISERLLMSNFGGDSSIVGRDIRFDDTPYRVVGVVPQSAEFGVRQLLAAGNYGGGFASRGGRAPIDVWVPLVASSDAPRSSHGLFVIAKLANTATLESSQQEMTRIARELEAAHPANVARGVFVEPVGSVIFADSRTPLLVLLGAVILVVVAACSNVANLMLARHNARMHDVTVRLALGASRARLARQFLVENVVLVVLGGALALLLAEWVLTGLLALSPPTLPRIDAVAIDSRVLLWTGVLTAVIAVMFTMLPLLQSRTLDVSAGLHTASRGMTAARTQNRWRNALVVVQFGMAVMLLSGAGLLVRSLWELQQVDPGFASDGVLKAEYQLPASRYPRDMRTFPDFPEQRRFNQELQLRAHAIPGVTHVAIAVSHPLDGGFTSSVSVVGRESESASWPEPSVRMVSASYFDAMQVPARTGRLFTDGDGPGEAPVVVINEAAKERFFASQDPIGQHISLWGARRLVVGVVGNERIQGLANDAPPAVYLPVDQVPSIVGAHTVLLRTSGNPVSLVAPLRDLVRDLDATLPLYGVESLEQTIAGSLSQRRFTMMAVGAFALLATTVAALGVYGVLAYLVQLRTREIGIRTALGATPRDVRRAVLLEGCKLAGMGLVVGIAGALVLGRVLSSMLFGVAHYDPRTFAGVSVVLGAVALVACFIPARRAARVDPLLALRAD